MRRRFCWMSAGILLVLGSSLIGQGFWIHVKALTAQWLLQQAWTQTLKTRLPTKPWPWADTWPVGRLLAPHYGIDQIILADASGQSLAFGPGHLTGSAKLGERGTIVLSGHRDTHFQFLQHLQKDEVLAVESPDGSRTFYTIQELSAVDSRYTNLPQSDETEVLILTTCYPFDALVPGGPLRYVVRAEKIPS